MPARFTRADYNRLPEGFPAQLVAGWLVKDDAPTYGHQYVAHTLLLRLASLVGLGRALGAPQDVGIDDWNVFQPDVMVMRKVPPLDVSDVGIPLLAIEVISPTTARRDRNVKRRRLLKAGVEEVWIVDRASGTVEVYDAAGCRSASGDETISSRVVLGFEVVPSQLFAPPTA